MDPGTLERGRDGSILLEATGGAVLWAAGLPDLAGWAWRWDLYRLLFFAGSLKVLKHAEAWCDPSPQPSTEEHE